MKLIDEFETFLVDVVNLNKSRIKTLVEHVSSIQNFVSSCDWGPLITRYSAQGSWAHRTIIKPPTDTGFDADLLVFVNHVPSWTANAYVAELGRAFRASNTYKDNVTPSNRCVTVEYAGDFNVDVMPCVVGRPASAHRSEVCNSRDGVFEPTDSEPYTAWFNDRNTWSANNKLREVMRWRVLTWFPSSLVDK